jgi:hypothetical protein
MVYKPSNYYKELSNSELLYLYKTNRRLSLTLRVSNIFKKIKYNFFNKINFSKSSKSLNFLKTNVLKTLQTDNSFKTNEVKIPRIRFKPGYKRIWRRARIALKESLNIKFLYQKQLTKYLTRFFRWSNLYYFSKNELTLYKIIIYSRLIPDNSTFIIFLQNKLIYLNGNIVFNKFFTLSINDFLQLIISKWYYIYYRWLINLKENRLKKFKRLIFRKNLASKYKIIKLKKQKSIYTPDWIFLLRYDISDVKPFLEVDYLTLSTFVIYEPTLQYSYSSTDIITHRPNIYRLYNWKYIT